MSDHIESDYKLRDVHRVNNRERNESSFEEDDTLLAGDVDVSQQSDSSLNDTCFAVADDSLPSCSTPIVRERLTASVISDFGPFVGISPVGILQEVSKHRLMTSSLKLYNDCLLHQ